MPAMSSGLPKTWATTLPVAGSSARISTSPTSGSGKIDVMKSRRVAVVVTAVVASDIAVLRAEQFLFDEGRNGVPPHTQALVTDRVEDDAGLPDGRETHDRHGLRHDAAVVRAVWIEHAQVGDVGLLAQRAWHWSRTHRATSAAPHTGHRFIFRAARYRSTAS